MKNIEKIKKECSLNKIKLKHIYYKHNDIMDTEELVYEFEDELKGEWFEKFISILKNAEI